MRNESVIKAELILAGSEAHSDEILAIVKELKADFEFGLARRLLAKVSASVARERSSYVWYRQQLALCTYKDEELIPAKRFAEALEILKGIGLRNPETNDPETLALGGSVYKRMWEHHGHLVYLYDALSLYRAAYERAPEKDLGYGGINAAYILQVLAARARASQKRSGIDSKEYESYRAEADALREKIVRQLERLFETDPSRTKEYWLVATLAEAFYGLKNYPEAGKWLARSREAEISEWELQTTFRQLVSIARRNGVTLPGEGTEPAAWDDAWKALVNLMGEETEAALSCYRGKVGLALSGGGFRASFYHLGVLARLAEMDVLRSVETLSTVSGGSIVGAQYYLAVKRCLEDKKDSEITREDYIKLVAQVLEDFFNGVKKNIRTQALADFKKNLRMIGSDKYSRSHRLGELYDQIFYSQFKTGRAEKQPITMKELLIHPRGEGQDFRPKFSNWRRRAKIPNLLLNATSLNTGHNWHFTARTMGEPPGLLGSEVDKNSRYRRLWYDQAPDPSLKDYPLGYAVAASACVPGLFEPLALQGLYPDRLVRLVDGGVHDNQGVQGLLDEDCSFVLCSDASGQMQDTNAPSDGLPSVLLRTNSIMMDRIREAQYQDLRSREDSHAIQGLFFIHLLKDLHTPTQDWIHCQDPSPVPENTATTLPYGIDPDLQKLIAGIRTDLDSFSEVEAYSLMYSGYVMTEQQFNVLQEKHLRDGHPGTWGGFDVDAPRAQWRFLHPDLESALQTLQDPGEAGKDLKRQLEVGSLKLFKVWQLNRTLKFSAYAAACLLAVVLFLFIKPHWQDPLFSFSTGSFIIALLLLALTCLFPFLKWLRPEKAARNMLLKVLIAFLGYLGANLHIAVFNNLFLERGRLDRLFTLKRQ